VRVAVLCDVHGNVPALEAVLAEVDREQPDALVSGGDLVSGPYPSECLELLRARGARFLRGNADRLMLEQSGEDAWAYPRLSDEQRELVRAWPETLALDVDGLGPVRFCHGSPRSDEEQLTALTREDVVREALADVEERTVVCGHTHHQFDRRVGERRLLNPGSVGLPYEGRRGAFWALLGPDVSLRRTDYDVEAAVESLLRTDYPRLAAYLESSLLRPIARDAAVEAMEPAERRGA
jgi:putative phosphoesterase